MDADLVFLFSNADSLQRFRAVRGAIKMSS